MAATNKLFLQNDALGGIIVGSKIEFVRSQKQLTRVFCKKGALESFQEKKVDKKAPVLEFLFNKVADLKPSTLLKRNSSTGGLLWVFVKFLSSIQSKVCERLLLHW